MRPATYPTFGPSRRRASWFLVVLITLVAAAIVAAPVSGADRPVSTEGGGSPHAGATVFFEESVSGSASDSREVTSVGTLAADPDDFYLCVVSVRRVREVQSVTGFGLTWTRMAAQCSGHSQTSLEVWQGTGEPTYGPVTATLDKTAKHAIITVARFSGVDPWAPLGSSVAVNTNGPDGGCDGGIAREEFAATLSDVGEGAGVFGFLTTRSAWPTGGRHVDVLDRQYAGTGPDATGLGLIGLTAQSPGTVTLEGTFDRYVDWALVALEIQPVGATPSPRLHVAAGEGDFGTVFVTAEEFETFTFENAGARDLVVSSVSAVGTVGDFSVASGGGPFTLAPGQVRDVVVRFAPGSGGARAADLRVVSDDPWKPRFDLPLSGVGDDSVPAAGVDRAGHDYGDVLIAPPGPAAGLRDHDEDTGPSVLHQDPDHPSWLLDAQGNPKFICGSGDPEGFLYRDENDQEEIIEALAASGANSIYFAAIRSHGGDGTSDENPFIDNSPSNGLDPAVLDQWDTWFTQMDAAGIVMFFFFYDDAAGIWNTGDSVGSDEREYFSGIVNRFEHHENIVWVVAEEYDERLTQERASNLAEVIAEEDDYGHPIGVHQRHGLDFDFAGDDHVDVFMMQDNLRSASQLNEDMNAAFSGDYVLTMSESREHYWDESGHLQPLSDFRRKNWAIGMGGAYSMALRMFVTPEQWPPPSYLRACGMQVEFFEQTNFPAMVPANELARLDTEYVLADHAGESFILYSTDAGTLGLDWEDGFYDLLWFDTETGEQVDVRGVPFEGTFVKPGHFGSDVAVWARRVIGVATTTFELRNEGSGDLVLNGVEVVGADASEFEVTDGAELAAIPPGATHEITVAFTPAMSGPRGTTLRVQTNDPDDPTLEVSLIGWGVVSASPDISGGPASCDFGPVEVAEAMPRSVQIRNDGASDLHVTASGLSGPQGNDFRVEAGGGAFTLTPGAVRQIDLSFEPGASGLRQGVLTLTSNDPDDPQFEIPLAGTGVASLGGVVFEESVTGVASSTRWVRTAESLLGVTGDVYVATIGTRRVRSVVEVTGLGLEWRRVREQCSARSQTSVSVWVAQGDALAGPVTARVDHSTKNLTIAVARYSGAHSWAPVGVVASENTQGSGGACGTQGVDVGAWEIGLAPIAPGARVVGAVAARQRTHSPGEGVILREDVRVGEGADMASVVLVDRPSVIGGGSLLNGVFDREADWAVAGIELRPAGAVPSVPDVSVDLTSLDFSGVVVGELTEASVAVHNTGAMPLEVTATTILGADGAEFVVAAGAAPFTVGPGDDQSVVVRFSPTFAGSRKAVLRLETNDPDEGQVHVQLVGTGEAPPPGPTVVLEGSASGSASGSSLVVTSDTIGGEMGDVFIAVISAGKFYEPVVDVSGLGLSWTLVRAQCSGLVRTGVEIWFGRGVPTEGKVTASLAGLPRNVVLWVGRYSGAHPMAPIGAVLSANANGTQGACDVGTDGTEYSTSLLTTGANAYLLGAVAKRERFHFTGEGWTTLATLSEGRDKNTAGLALVRQTVAQPGSVPFEGTFDGEVHWAIAAIELLPADNAGDPATGSEIGATFTGPLSLRVHGNPSRAGTPADLRFALPADGPARLEIFDVRGRRVRTLVNGSLVRGAHHVTWRGDDARGRALGSGVYFLRLSTGGESVVRKITRVR